MGYHRFALISWLLLMYAGTVSATLSLDQEGAHVCTRTERYVNLLVFLSDVSFSKCYLGRHVTVSAVPLSLTWLVLCSVSSDTVHIQVANVFYKFTILQHSSANNFL